MRPWTQSRLTWIVAGIVVGLVIGLNIQGLWPNIPLHATATHGLDKFAIATGLVDDSVEALAGFGANVPLFEPLLVRHDVRRGIRISLWIAPQRPIPPGGAGSPFRAVERCGRLLAADDGFTRSDGEQRNE